MKHESLGPTHDKMINTCDGMRPDFWTGVFKELKEFGYHEV